jgi:thymidylate kinase
VVLEGVIGSGKSTQTKLLANYFKEHFPKKQKIQQSYYELAELPFLKKRYVIIDGNKSITDVHTEIVDQINKRLKLKS